MDKKLFFKNVKCRISLRDLNIDTDVLINSKISYDVDFITQQHKDITNKSNHLLPYVADKYNL